MQKIFIVITVSIMCNAAVAQTADTSLHNSLKADIHESNWCIAGSLGFQKIS